MQAPDFAETGVAALLDRFHVELGNSALQTYGRANAIAPGLGQQQPVLAGNRTRYGRGTPIARGVAGQDPIAQPHAGELAKPERACLND